MTIGYLKGKSAVRIHRELMKTHGTLFKRSFWSREYCVSTVGLDEMMIRRYIQEQAKHERDQERGDDGTWKRLHDEFVQFVRRKACGTPKSTVAIIDSQSVITTSVAGSRGYDGGLYYIANRNRFDRSTEESIISL